MAAAAASPPTLISPKKYDVFLSFRGDDTRDNITSHLYAAFERAKLETYIDYRLKKGEEIWPELQRAIEESKLSVVIFSERYAQSSWCLKELVHILQRRENFGQIVIPIFYHVDPSNVRKQEESFDIKLSMPEERHKDKMNEWGDALTTSANIAGWDSATIKPESELVEAAVQDIIKQLKRGSSSDDSKDIVGINERLRPIESLLDISSQKTRFVGIRGMGGIGKTTLAHAVYNRLSYQFDACCFLENVRELWEKGRQKVRLRNKLFYDLLGEAHLHMETMYLRMSDFDKERLQRKKVLIVLDDVDERDQLEILAGDRTWFRAGSRIIITSRNAQVLSKVDAVHEVDKLDPQNALHLFRLNAFEKNSFTTKDYEELSSMLVEYAKGVPLALEVLGSSVYKKPKNIWESTLDKLKKYPPSRVQDVLRVSYDGLDCEEKKIFLDIACFFKGDDKDFAKGILDGCGFSTDKGIDDLIDRSLITIVDSNKLWMHDLIEDMGRAIVREKSEDPGQRSRLWNHEDVCKVFRKKSETVPIEGIFLDMSRIPVVDLHPTIFSKMHELRILKLHNYFSTCRLCFSQGDLELPDALRFLYWDEYPSRFLPPSFCGENLVELKLQYSQLEQLWEGVQSLENLKAIDLSFSKHLIKIPDLSQALNVERVTLKFCERLHEVPSYFEDLTKLTSLNLKGCILLERVSALPGNIIDVNLKHCTSLESLPTNICSLTSIRRLELSGCSKLDYSPELLEFLQQIE